MQRTYIDTDRYRTSVFEGVGHGPLIERSDRVAELLAEVAARRAAP